MPIPIFAPYTWEETEATVTVTSRIHGATSANTDFFASPHYVKANSKQSGGALHLLELDLFGEVDAMRSSAAVETGVVKVLLHKAQPGLWGQLVIQSADKAERMRRRKRSIEVAERQAAQAAEAAKKQTWENSRHTLKSQMDLDRAYRGVLEDRKAREKAKEEADLAEWQSATEEARLVELRERYGMPPAPTAVAAEGAAHDPAGARTPQQPAKALPPVRSKMRVQLKFTPKMTAAPLRTKGKDAAYDPEPVPLDKPGLGPTRARALKAGDLYDISQRDPAWLKDRGDRFFQIGDYQAAANAYTAVLAQFPDKIPAQAVDTYLACLSNRAACHLALDDLNAAAADATHAITLHDNGKSISNVPLTDDELAERARARKLRLLMRRGAALCHAGLLEQASADFELAVADYAPKEAVQTHAAPSAIGVAAEKAALRADALVVKERLTRVLNLKAEADHLATAALSAGDDAGAGEGGTVEAAAAALAAYGQALDLAPCHVPTLANAAAVALAAGAWARCVALCDTALTTVDSGLVDGPLCSVRVRIKLLVRRATAKTELGNWKAAHRDLVRASGFAPSDTAITAQIKAVVTVARENGVEIHDARSAALATTSAALRVDDADAGAGPEPADEGPAGGEGARPRQAGRVAVDIKVDAEHAFAAGNLEEAVRLFGEALAADAQREWAQLGGPSSSGAGEANAPAAEPVGGEAGEGSDEGGGQKTTVVSAPPPVTGGLQFRCQCLSNRAACSLKLGDFAAVLDDCSAALAAVNTAPMDDEARTQLTLKLRLRRGTAYAELGRLDDALAEYDKAYEIAPENQGIKDAIVQLRASRGVPLPSPGG